jgi:hypothetical protein
MKGRAMTRRRRRLLVALAVLALGGVLALPGVHWRLVGWWRGEPFYRGRPVSYYAAKIRAAYEQQPEHGYLKRRDPPQLETWARLHAPRWLVTSVWGDSDVWDRLVSDGKPVFMALLAEPDWRVKAFAMKSLPAEIPEGGAEPPETRAARTVQALTPLLDDPHPLVRSFAALLLGELGPPLAVPAVPKLLRLQGDQGVGVYEWTVGEMATTALRRIDPDALKEPSGRP